MADLIVLDFLAKQNRKNEDYLITFDDEYFYAYLVWSLKDFVLNLAQGMLQDNISLLFNPAAYIHSKDTDFRHLDEEIHKRYENQIKNLDLAYYGLYFYYEGFFEMDPFDYFSDDRKKIPNTILRLSYTYTPFKSPNVIPYDYLMTQFELKFKPSPLGKYYFELTYQRGNYLELIQPYYPTNPPKAWTKQMMEKLNLKLE